MSKGHIVARTGTDHVQGATASRLDPKTREPAMSHIQIPASIEASPVAAQPLLEAVKKQPVSYTHLTLPTSDLV